MYKNFLLLIFIVVLISSCSTTKNIPENKYLMNSIKVTHDTRNAASDLESFSRQQPNNKVRLMIYNAAGTDTTKWMNRFIRKLGQAPVVYDAKLAQTSAEQIQKELVNQGYLNARVDTSLNVKGRKMNVIYNAVGGTPYKVRNYEYQIRDTTMARIMNIIVERLFKETEIKSGDYFDMTLMEAERDRVSAVMRNVGYADFSKEYVYFRADTTLNTHEVDLFLDIYPPKEGQFNRYAINDVTVISGFNADEIPTSNSRGSGGSNRFFRRADTTHVDGMTIIRGRDKFLRNSVIRRNNYLHKGSNYSDVLLSMTYESFSKMGAVRQVNITTHPSPEDSLKLMDATIILTPANAHWFRASLDGTNSAGDIGIAPSVSYQHQNLFNGSEKLAIRLKGAYEFIAKTDNSSDVFNQNYYEYGTDISLTFPQFIFPWLKKSWREQPSATTVFSVGLNNQKRPEYSRQFFNFTANYNWSTSRNKFSHGLDLLDINYVRMPWTSDQFREDYLEDGANPLLKESYKDQLIARMAYNGTITKGRRFNLQNATSTIRFGAEVSGLLPRLAAIGKSRKGSDDARKILGVSYAEYIKGSFDWAQTFRFSKKHSIAYHAGIGAAHPYGNSNILPFERRFFAGGANSLRGWNTRGLGPGSFKPLDDTNNFVNQAGDLLLVASVEDRYKVTDLIELAAFLDAGNIWTIKKYKGQEGGQFSLKRFYEEIALAYGTGFRFDLGFLLIRLDVGLRLYDPGRDKGDRFVAPAWKRTAWHFGIGYPF